MRTETYTSTRQWFSRMIETESAPSGPMKVLFFLLNLISWLYEGFVRLRLQLYGLGILRSRRLPKRVISIGNITVGGTGKTPMVLAVARHFFEKGMRVAVLSRGYGRRAPASYRIVSDGTTVFEPPETAGDEACFIAAELPGVVVAVGKNRFRAGMKVLEKYEIDLFILDDGYQHLSLHRDFNLLMMDALRPFGNGKLLPRGPLREPLSSMRRASMILLTRKNGNSAGLTSKSKDLLFEGIPTISVSFQVKSFTMMKGGEEILKGNLSGRSCLAVSGIADPGSFKRMLDQCGLQVARELVFPDHHTYNPGDIEAIYDIARSRKVDFIITTDKDAVKLKVYNRDETPVLILKLAFFPIDPFPWASLEKESQR